MLEPVYWIMTALGALWVNKVRLSNGRSYYRVYQRNQLVMAYAIQDDYGFLVEVTPAIN